MKKKFVILLLGAFAFGLIATEVLAKELKVGYVDMQKIFNEYKKTKEAESDLESKGKVKTEEREKMVEDIRRLKDEIELLSDKNKEKKQNEIDGKIQQLQEFDRKARGELLQEREDVLREITKDIDRVIQNYGKKHDYDIIFNRDKRVLLYDKGDADITESVLRELNK